METGRDALAGLRILIVEDEFLVAMLVEEMLQTFAAKLSGRYLPSKRLSRPYAKTVSMGRCWMLT